MSAPAARRAPSWPTLAVAPVVGGWLALLWAWPSAPFFLTFDDAFYYFEIARNLASGAGATFDRLNPTNGFHPAWLAIATLPFLAGLDGLEAVRALLALDLLLWGAAMALALARLRPSTPWLCALAALPLLANPYVVKAFANGLETALYALFLAALLAHSLAMRGDWLGAGRARRWVAGLLLAGAFLARTDAVFVLAALALVVSPEALRRRRLDAVIEVFAVPALTVIAFMAANALFFGTALQVSGSVKRLPLEASGLALFAFIVVAFVAAARLLAGRAARVPLPRTCALLAEAAWLPLACGLIAGYYLVLQAFPRLWHFAPVVLFGIVLFLAIAADLLALTERRKSTLAAILAAPLAVALLLQGARLIDPATVAARLADRDAALWIAANLPTDTVLGSWDAGIIGYFAPQRVINLDGVVNSPTYAAALREGTAGALLRAQGLAYLVNHDAVSEGRPEALVTMAGDLLGAETAETMRLVKSWPFTFSGSSNRAGRGRHAMAVFLYALPEGSD